jgi:hypothetical protein
LFVDERELLLSSKELGSGATGRVVEGKFRGRPVSMTFGVFAVAFGVGHCRSKLGLSFVSMFFDVLFLQILLSSCTVVVAAQLSWQRRCSSE